MGSGSTPKGGRAIYKNSGVLFIRSQNVYNDGLRIQNAVYIDESIDCAMAGSRVEPLDLLLNITGASIGRCAIMPNQIQYANVNQHVLIVRCVDKSIIPFIHSCLISPYIFQSIMDVQVGETKEGLSAQKASQLLVPIAPLQEQRRIVERLESLMACIPL